MTDIKSKLAAIRTLCDEVEKAVPGPVKEEKAVLWNPRVMGQPYYLISSAGVSEDTYTNHPTDENRIATGNVFPTREAAQKEYNRRIVTQKLRELAGGFVPDWSNGSQPKYFLVYDYEEKRWWVDKNNIYYTPTVIYFQHREDLEAAIKTLGAELDVLL